MFGFKGEPLFINVFIIIHHCCYSYLKINVSMESKMISALNISQVYHIVTYFIKLCIRQI